MRDRAVTTALNYVLLLGIVSILVSTLVFGFGGLVTDQQERAVRSQLEAVGNGLAEDVVAVDGVATRTDGTVRLRSDLPTRVVGSRYTVVLDDGAVADDGRYRLTLRSTDPSVEVSVSFRSRTPVESVTVRGGRIDVVYDPTTPEGVVLRG